MDLTALQLEPDEVEQNQQPQCDVFNATEIIASNIDAITEETTIAMPLIMSMDSIDMVPDADTTAITEETTISMPLDMLALALEMPMDSINMVPDTNETQQPPRKRRCARGRNRDQAVLTTPVLVSFSLPDNSSVSYRRLLKLGRAFRPKHYIPMKRTHHGIFLSLYGGAGHVAEAWRAHGREALVVDCSHSSNNDLGTELAQTEVTSMLRYKDADSHHGVAMLGIDLPCETWSRARGGGHGPPAIRSSNYVMGLPGIRAHDQRKVDAANKQLANALTWVNEAVALGIPGYLENGVNTFLWSTEGVSRLRICEGVVCSCTPMCVQPPIQKINKADDLGRARRLN